MIMFGKLKGNETWKKRRRKEKANENKNTLKFDILFLFGASNQFYLFQLVNMKIK